MRTNRTRVLYVEDDRASMLLMRHLFRKKFPEVVLLEAETSERGIELAQSCGPSLILMDIVLPGADGYEGLDRLRNLQETAGIPVWAISALAMEEDVQKALEAGFIRYIRKPLNVEDFARGIQTFFDEKNQGCLP
ncbi:response regulator [Saccharibacillus sp. O23]|uniref:response regulator n=1 Tax=Saccharibacillus sp. O23 TaxID=2009338 RepID=UPI0015C5E19C|nr:response regulator [Saccharibacillus sp. O23]